MLHIRLLKIITLLFACWFMGACSSTASEWEEITAVGKPTARHEAGVIGFDNKLYLLGGRRVNPTDVYDPQTSTWTAHSPPPIEVHHFQPVVYGDAIYIVGAMTGGWPNETPLERVLIYYPKTDTYEFGHEIPESRRRGGAGAVVYDGKIYLVGGITEGHMQGFKPWLDEYNPKTGQWVVLPDAQNARDHFQAAVVNNKLYAFAGRQTSKATGEHMTLTVKDGNVFDFQTGQWQAVTGSQELPTPRAGNAVFVWNDHVVVGGGESMTQKEAHSEIEAFDVNAQTWEAWPSMVRGRHGMGFVIIGDYVYTASGSGNRGGSPELHSVERFKLSDAK